MASSTYTEASYESVIMTALDSTTGAKTVTVETALQVFSTGDVVVINLGADNEEWFEVTDLDTSASTITLGTRGLSLTVTETLTEVAANRKAHGPGEPIAVVTFPNKIHTQNTDVGTDSTDFEINTGGSSATLDTTGLTVDRTFTFPDEDDEVAGIDSTQTFTNKTVTSIVLNTEVSGTAILDEDDLVSDSATQLATQQSIKAYVDTQTTTLPSGATLTSPVINTGVSGTAISSSFSTPGSSTILATTKGVVDYLTAISPGVLSVSSDGGTDRNDDIDLVSGTYVSITDNGDDSFTFDNNTDQIYLFSQIFA